MPIRRGDEEKLAEALVKDEEKRKQQLPPPQTSKEQRVMRQVRDTDIEGDN